MISTASRVFLPEHLAPHANDYMMPEKRQRFDPQAMGGIPPACAQPIMHYSPSKSI